MARQQRKMLPAQPLPPPPSKLSRSAAANEYEGRKMVGKNGDTLVRVARGTKGRHRMRKGGSPDSETPTPTTWPAPAWCQAHTTGRPQMHSHPRPCQFLLGACKTAILSTRQRGGEGGVQKAALERERGRQNQTSGEGREGAAKKLSVHSSLPLTNGSMGPASPSIAFPESEMGRIPSA